MRWSRDAFSQLMDWQFRSLSSNDKSLHWFLPLWSGILSFESTVLDLKEACTCSSIATHKIRSWITTQTKIRTISFSMGLNWAHAWWTVLLTFLFGWSSLINLRIVCTTRSHMSDSSRSWNRSYAYRLGQCNSSAVRSESYIIRWQVWDLDTFLCIKLRTVQPSYLNADLELHCPHMSK